MSPPAVPATGRLRGSRAAAGLLAAVLAAALAACADPPAPTPTPTPSSAPSSAPSAPSSSAPVPEPSSYNGTAPLVASPALRVETVVGGLANPWDVAPIGGGRMLVTERDGRLGLVTGTGPGATVRPVAADLSDVYARGESGLMGIAAYPDVATSGAFLTCQAHQRAGQPTDIRVVAWRLSPDGTRADKVRDPLVGGLPLNPSGRHGGCRPTFAPDGTLYVGTGDTARATIAQDRNALGGKVLRIDPRTGGPAPGNPFAGSASAAERLISGYGHRNVQAVAIQPGTGTAWSAEQGSDVDDEVNVVVPGANYGWDPARGGETPGGYDESVPMTDQGRYPDARPAAWSSGDPTEATSGAEFLAGPAWGDLAGTLAVCAQKGEKLILLRPGTGPDAQRIVSASVPPELDGAFDRLRGARLGPDGALYLTTDNGSDDRILRVSRM